MRVLGSDAVQSGRNSDFVRAHRPKSSVVMPNAGFREEPEYIHEKNFRLADVSFGIRSQHHPHTILERYAILTCSVKTCMK